jgi:TolB-like protein/class 3 adenylate cyclase
MTATPRADPILPTGTVTFLFTDVEGSTRLWEAHRAAMQHALARHDALLRQCIERNGGHVVKSVGDGVCAAFVSATDALEASIAAQHALATEPWPEPVKIRVRMALHSGPAELRDGDYFGPTLNRVARLLALGRGGQTLVSAITYDLCRHYLPPEVLLRSLGEHTLKDLDRSEAVFEVTRGRSPAFPPSKAPPAAWEANMPSIAVLPFINMSGDEENEYFAEGLAEELLNVLSKIRGLRVASRTSAFSFKGTKVDIPTVAQKLNVATILEGSVRKAGRRVRITAQLVEVATDSHLWSGTYDRELEDIFAVQDDIAQSVVKELRAALLEDRRDLPASTAVKAEVQAAAKGRGENAEAYRLYLQGRTLVSRRTQASVSTGIEYLRQAVSLDPVHALAWAALSASEAIAAGSGGWTPFDLGYGRAREAAERALALEPDLAEGHAALAGVYSGYDWDWSAADASMRRALELAPGSVDVVLSAAGLTGNLGRLEEAIALCQQAIALDPLNARGHRFLGMYSLFAGKLEEAEAALKDAVELNPLGGMTYRSLGQVYLAQGRSTEALAAFKEESHEGFRLLGLAAAYHALGQNAHSSAALEQLAELPMHAFLNAQANAYCGDVDQAFEWLERAYMQRNAGLSQMKVEPFLQNLHGDPRWPLVLKKMGLAD